MSWRAMSFVLFWVVVIQFAGCASYNPGSFPQPPPEPESAKEPVEIRVNSMVRLVTTDGGQYSGEVVRVSANAVAIGKVGNYGYEELIFPRGRIASIEVRKESGVATALVASIGVVALGVFALATLIVASGGIGVGS
jgi:hypothetical protein